MGLKAGTITDFENSMAAAIEAGFERAWDDVQDVDLPDEGRPERRILFVAVAQGVVKYLSDHAGEGFDVVADGVQKNGNQIESRGTLSRSDFGPSGEASVSVTQDAGADNRVESSIEDEDAEIAIHAEGLYS